MSDLTKKAKGAIIGSVAGLAAIAVGVGIWQPWKADEPDTQVDPPKQENVQPQPPEEEQLTLNVGGDKIPCTLYEGDGWSIWVPEGWSMYEEDHTLSPQRAGRDISIQIVRGGSGEAGDIPAYTVIGGDGSGFGRTFYSGMEQGDWYVHTRGRGGDSNAGKELWQENEKLLNAVARSFALDGEKVFEYTSLAQEPEWQISDGDTILWLDKDGYSVSEKARQVTEDYMRSWDQETKANFTGQYKLQGLAWTASYAELTDGIVDVFSCLDCYKVAPDSDNALYDGDITDGWYYNSSRPLVLAVFHDGGDVAEVKVLRDSPDGWSEAPFAGELLMAE